MAHASEMEEDIIKKAKLAAEKVIEQAEEKAERMQEKKQQQLDAIEDRMLKREEKMDERLLKLDEQKDELKQKQEEAKALLNQQKDKLEEIAGFKAEDAKEQLFKVVEEQNQKEINEFIEKFKMIKKEQADEEASQIIARVLPRMSGDVISDFTSNLVDIPNEDFKGKLIGREGRNINFLEKVTGAEIIVDDTPLVVKVSCYEPERRFIAVETLKRLIKDGRINPHYIEKIHQEITDKLDDILMDKGKEALQMLNIPMMKPEIVQLVGKFHLRFSYGQNLWKHSIEVAKMCEAIATEMGMDPLLAKKAGLLHDIGKVIANTGESHTALGADALRKHGMHEVIINAAESHHYDVPMTTPMSWIVAAADAMSASRPGARYNTSDMFIEKMGELEKLISEIEGVSKVHIMQAGRDIMVYVDPNQIKDTELQELLKTIGKKIEDQLDYPGIIRVSAIRENKMVEFLR
jgi:ribonuclease Y